MSFKGWSRSRQAVLKIRPTCGRRFGLPRNTRAKVVDFHRATALRGFVTLLGAVGLTLDDVQLVDLPTAPRGLADEPAVLDSGAARLLATERGQEFSFR